jgi:hypothetical protein
MITEHILPQSMGQEARDILLVRQSALLNIKKNLQLAQDRMKKQVDESSRNWGHGLPKAPALHA